MIFGVPWQFWVLVTSIVAASTYLEKVAERSGLLKPAKEIDSGWAHARGRLLNLALAVPVVLIYFALGGQR